MRVSSSAYYGCAAPLLLIGVLAVNGGSPRPAAPETPTTVIDFNRDIRPLLADNCWKCHGPDEKERKGKLRLDTREGALAPRKDGAAIVPGEPAKSLVLERLTSDDAELRMPPKKTGKQLTPKQVELVREWIKQGAKWNKHWAFVPPQRPAVPTFRGNSQIPYFPLRNSIDHFVLARLRQEGLQPSPEADRPTLIRRLTFDLTGLPPTPAEIDAFLTDTRDGAYERHVDRLLASPRYGERMALDWLDAARFADTHGYHIDSGRDMSRWREWVIDAFNNNKPFDKFTIEQLAGDLLPNPTLEQRVASGFNRNHMINFEGGAIPEEYHTAYIVDRVNTTATVWLGLTIGCAQCHDHKYDPITQKEFYQLFAFFHNVPENGLDGSKGNAAPLLRVPTRQQEQRLARLAEEIKQLDARLEGPWPELDAPQQAWERQALNEKSIIWTPWDVAETRSDGDAKLIKLKDFSIQVSGPNPAKDVYRVAGVPPLKKVTGVRVEVLPNELPGQGKLGRSANGNYVLTRVEPVVLGGGQPIVLKAASASFSQQDFPVGNAIDPRTSKGWATYPEVEKPNTAVFAFAEPLELKEGMQLGFNFHFQSIFAQHQWSRFRLAVTDADQPLGTSSLPEAVRASLAVPVEKRNAGQLAELRRFYRSRIAKEGLRLGEQAASLKKEQADLEKQIPTTMVMQEMPKARDTFLLVRGQYDKKGEKVTAGVPAFLPSLSKPGPPGAGRGDAPTRLDLARWLVDPRQPLTARVIVNRYWQMYFGTGLVKTAEDFGSQGELPSHPELLDWLATEFVASGWDVKRMQKLIVMSATYRQSSAIGDQLSAIGKKENTTGALPIAAKPVADPENRLLSRGPRFRLQAEFIRDQALAVSGLLNGEIGGHSVSPYQPPGLWEELMSRADGANWTAQTYKQSSGKDLYRRTMYTFWKRTCPPPTLATFDAPDRETCTVRRARTNTPLQALILMNDPTYIEAARKLGERMMLDGGQSPDERIAFAFRLATARRPNDQEVALLRRLFDQQLARYRQDNAAALKLLGVGESRRNERLDAAELAAWSMVASVILNLDEVVTRG
jgi:hypothetical protein